MQKEFQRTVYTLTLTFVLALAAASAFKIQPSSAQETVVKVYPQLIEKGPENVTGQNVVVAVVVENVTDLYGFDIKFRYNITYLEYVGRNVTVPVEDYSSVQLPSPYAGILHTGDNGAPITVKNVLNTTTGVYQLAKASMAPAPSFNGSGTVFTMEFKIIHQQMDFEGDLTLLFDFVDTKLSDSGGGPISHSQEPGTFLLKGIPFEQPALPTLQISPAEYDYVGDMPATANIDLKILNLSTYWDLVGFDIKLAFDPDFLQVTNVTEGPFLELYNMTFVIKNEVNNTAGYIRLAYAQIMAPDERTIPSGNGTLFTFEIDAKPTSMTGLTIVKSSLASFPHEDRPEAPWLGAPWSVPIEHYLENGTLRIIHRKTHTITIGTEEFEIVTESNSTISDIDYSHLVKNRMIFFNATGVPGYDGYCNVTIPKDLMWAATEDWLVLVDGQLTNVEIAEDSTNAHLYFTYTFDSATRHCAISSVSAIPEFLPALMIVAFLAVSLEVATMVRRTRKRAKIQSIRELRI